MKSIGCAPVVRQEQQPQCCLRDEERLRQHETVRHESPGADAPSVGHETKYSSADADGDYRDAESNVHGYHRAHPTERQTTHMVEEGKPAPTFTLPTTRVTTSHSRATRVTTSLESLRGKPIVLYFYPKDDTPGCTAQACGIRDAWGEFATRGAVVLGVSPDNPGQHVKFKEKYGLPFTLLADEDHAVAETYGVWVEKSMYGKKYMGIERSTFVIDADGNIAKIMRKVKPYTHADDVLTALL